MIVKSALADLDLTIGGMRSADGLLILESGEGSSLHATVAMSPRDVMRALLAFALAPSAWLFVLLLPVSWMFRKGRASGQAGQYPGYRLNNPWLGGPR